MANSVEIKNLDLNFGAVKVLKQLNLDIAEGEFLVLLGSSGCGKSTLLNCIAGLLDVSDGQIFIKGENVTWAEPSDRGIGMVFQSYALYPQMTVRGNLSFGLKNAKVPKPEIAKRIARAADVLQIEPLLDRKPGALSGGQRQRVAIGRALVRDVDVFLFDEPLSNLDAKLRTDLRVELKRLHQQLKNTMIYVTHDQVEAMTLADRISIMKDGMIEQLDTPERIYAKPCNKYVADFIGSPAMNLFTGQLSDTRFGCNGFNLDVSGYEFSDSGLRDGAAWLGIRPEHIMTGDAAHGASYSGTAEIDIVEPMGSDTLVWVNFAGQSVRVRTIGQSGLKSGNTLTIGFDAARLHLFDKKTELRL
ncbi:ABC transporter ATP-binding protein [Octadecabacter antarcticus 307]|uniref:ABC transporter ATP-binding protein n=1 Tax=Octadecabacter antarcticus 307 TaxID=391626 RepID=M9RAH4_9RHOB|nr:ABC transporter ATP-binding protein [Octadecabacter antarcticus]AGI69649.1 ABC transporter ATP-binding protein [Octadecabacter antarcticus 307]